MKGLSRAAAALPSTSYRSHQPRGRVRVLAGAFVLLVLGAIGAPLAAGGASADESAATRILIYHDPNHSAAAVGRYDTAVGLLEAAGRSWTVRTVTGTGEADRLARVSNSVMPRFFLGDPTAPGWGPAKAKENNGGLRWLRSVLARPQAPSAPSAQVDRVPGFGSSTVSDQQWIRDVPIAEVTLPAASGGDGTLTYTLEPALPAGLTLDGRKISGTPTAAKAPTLYTWKATDSDANAPDTASLTFTVEVIAPAFAPAVGVATTVDWTVTARDAFNEEAITVLWAAYQDADKYKVEWKTGNQSYSAVRSHTTGADATRYTIGGLTPGAEYTIRVTAIETGSGSDVDLASREVQQITHGWIEAYVDPAPGEGGVRVEWFGTGTSDVVRGAAGYVIEWKESVSTCGQNGDFSGASSHSVTDAGTLTYNITGLKSDTNYDVRVTAYTAHGSASAPDGLSWTVCRTPTHQFIRDLNAVPVFNAEADALDVSWGDRPSQNAIPVVGYVLQWKKFSEASYPRGNVVTPSGNSTRLTGLESGTRYSVKVTSRVRIRGRLVDGTHASADGTTPGMPLALAGFAVSPVAGSTPRLKATWSAPAPPANLYVLEWEEQGGSSGKQTMTICGPAAGGYATQCESGNYPRSPVSATTGALSPDTAYTVRVLAYIYRGRVEALGEATTGRTLDAMGALTVTAVGADTLDVSWPAVNRAAGYTVQWKLDSAASYPDANKAEVTPGTTTAHQITSLTAGTTYDVKVTARFTVGGATVDGDSAEASGTTNAAGTTAAVAGLRVVATDAPATLVARWAPPDDSGVTGYLVQWKTGSESYSTSERNHTTGKDAREYTIHLAPGTSYDVRVTQQGGAGAGTALQVTGVTTRAWMVTARDDFHEDAVAVSWPAYPNADKYRVQWKTGNESYSTTQRSHTTGAGATGYTVAGLTTGAEYTFRVTAIDTQGATDVDLASKEVVQSSHGWIVADADPADGDATALDVTWYGTGAADIVEGAAGYVIQWREWLASRTKSCRDAAFLNASRASVTGAGTLTYRITGLRPDTNYDVRVTAYTANGSAADPDGLSWSDCRTPTHQSIESLIRIGRAVRPGNARMELKWTVGTSEHAFPVENYVVRWKKNSEADYPEANLETLPASARSVRLSGLTPGTAYTYQVTARVRMLGNIVDGAVRIATGLTGTVSASAASGPAVSVADARVGEAAGATLDFTVTLDRAAQGGTSVDYETSDGTATAGADYTATSGTLAFAAGETSRTVSVPVLDDVVDEGNETLTLTLSNPSGLRIADGEATGTIENSDPMPGAWVARMGRTVGSQAVDALAARLEGGGETRGTVAGIAVGTGGDAFGVALDGRGAHGHSAHGGGIHGNAYGTGLNGRGPEARTMTAEELLLGSAFHLSSGGREAGRPGFAAWGRFARNSFEAEDSGASMEGDVTTGFLGADVEWDRMLAGVMVSHSWSEGAWRAIEGSGRGRVESTLTGLYPYARLTLSERVSAWGLAGMGEGELTLKPDGQDAMETDVTLRMGALGVAGRVLDGGEDGLALTVKSDAMWVGMDSEAAEGLAASESEVTRLRLIVEGARAFELGDGATLIPSAEAGLRVDGGDAETGTGVEVGAGVNYTAGRLVVEGAVRALVAHEASGFEEWGASGALRLAPGASGRGLSLSLSPTWGNAANGAEKLWQARDASALGLAEDFEPETRLAAELGYGVALFSGRFTGTPHAGMTLTGSGRDYRIGWRLTSAVPGDPGFAVGLEASRRESANDNAAHGVMLRGSVRW